MSRVRISHEFNIRKLTVGDSDDDKYNTSSVPTAFTPTHAPFD